MHSRTTRDSPRQPKAARHMTLPDSTSATLQLGACAVVGQPAATMDTPALMLDLDAFERNLAQMQQAADRAGVQLRPHAKAHKCPEIALAQIARGAAGICCQKVSEALPFVQAGVRDIHISNEIAGPAKAALLTRLARHARMSVCVDDARQVAALAQAAAQAGSAGRRRTRTALPAHTGSADAAAIAACTRTPSFCGHGR